MSASHSAQPLKSRTVAICSRSPMMAWAGSPALTDLVQASGSRRAGAGNRIMMETCLASLLWVAISTVLLAQPSAAALPAGPSDPVSLREIADGRPPALADRLQESDLIRRQLTLKGQRLQERWANVIPVNPASAEINRSWLEGLTRGDEYLRRCEHMHWQVVELRNDLDYFQQLSQSRLPAAAEGLDRFPSRPSDRSTNQTAEFTEHLQRLREARQAWQEQFDSEQQQSRQREEIKTVAIADSEIESLRRQVFAPNQLEPFADPAEGVEMMITWEKQCELLWKILAYQQVEMQSQRWEAVLRAMPRQIAWLDESINVWQQYERGIPATQQQPALSTPSETPSTVVKPSIKQSADVGTGANETFDKSKIADPALPTEKFVAEPLVESSAVPMPKRLENRINQLRLEQLQVAGQIATLRSKLEVLQQKIQSTGLNASNTALLLDTRRNLPLRQENRQMIRQLLEENRLETLEGLNLVERRELLRTQIAVFESQGDSASLHEKRDELAVLEAILESQNRYLELLSLLATEREALDQSLETIEEYLNYQLLWVRESEPYGRPQVTKAWEGIGRVLNPGDWFDLALNTGKRIWQRPYESFIAIVGLASLAYCTRWLRT